MSSDGLLTTLAQKADPGCAALLVIDVQNDFAADGGFFDRIGADVRSIQATVIPALIRLVDCARAAGTLVVFVQAIYDPKDLSAPMRERNRRRQVEMPRCLTGSWGADFHGVRPALGEPVVIKHRYSAMHKTELDAILKRHGICSLLLSGIATDTCVESTGRDAYFMDYYVTLVADCCGAFDESDHLGAIKRFDRDYGAVVTSDDLIDTWERRAQSVKRDVAATHG
ncbi:MAG: isochorismatase family cysteine hydrolase [Xanthobacteraceae bacterium]|jgi:ureidoacrylate peracid hydrolase